MRNLVIVLCCLLPTGSFAAAGEASAPAEDRPALKVNEVEHGAYFGVEAGGLFLFGPKSAGNGGFSPGRSFGITAGYEIQDFLSLAVLVMGSSISTPSGFSSDFTPEGSNSPMQGNFSSLLLGGMVKVSPIGFADSNSVKRLYLYARLGGGYALMSPKNFYEGGDIALLGGVGLEYFTHLRHFSLGLSADFFYGIQHMGPGFSLSPTLRYSF
ncbi:MAG: adventurous gliding motility protein CglE [Deltaproteobacteria bacterium]|nr:adventurous gliding motility protein CglE [Deltaproteobacteria bacterium]